MPEETNQFAAGTPVPSQPSTAATTPAVPATSFEATKAPEPSKQAAPAPGTLLGDPAKQKGEAANQAGGDAAEAHQTAPAEIAVQIPEGVQVDSKMLGDFKAWASAQGMKPEQAQALVNLQVEGMKRQDAARADAWAKQVSDWEQSARADKEYGGAKFDASLAAARKAVVAFGSESLTSYLNESGLGNHPELIRFCARIGARLAEDSIAGSSTPSNAPPSEEQLLARMYPSMFAKP